jgi:hypothetical protein
VNLEVGQVGRGAVWTSEGLNLYIREYQAVSDGEYPAKPISSVLKIEGTRSPRS